MAEPPGSEQTPWAKAETAFTGCVPKPCLKSEITHLIILGVGLPRPPDLLITPGLTA